MCFFKFFFINHREFGDLQPGDRLAQSRAHSGALKYFSSAYLLATLYFNITLDIDLGPILLLLFVIFKIASKFLRLPF
jgi:hypothetical protein